jgi:outer membrane protein, multidrug efflux system
MNLRALIATITVAALPLAGCMVGPDYQRPQTPLPAKYPDDAAASATPAPIRADWWTLYNDATLEVLVATALTDNLDVAFAVARIEEADANLREANASLFPEIDLATVGARSESSGAVTTPVPIRLNTDFRVALATSFEIDFWGRLRRMVESARAQALATHYARDVVTLSLAGLTTQTYFALRSLDAQVAATRETLATRDDYLNIV